ncbi:HAD-IA family hydrolase [Breoghania sp. L-A4]|uniref:HAD family hydrolase n=1 Tax=Breoghania sp. L-A4 TaxID=2304600 RepID=UPI000E35BD29|nr:HAD-IA family hydrolase [Breoghania sp. L-A4]AXS38934.1 HAD family hydrolase [Breoghania sp. L-A4]
MLPDLVIFDCDGVLVDTEKRSNEMLADVLTRDGFPMTYAESRRTFTGRSAASIQKMVEAQSGLDLGADWVDRLHSETEAIFAQGVPAIPGVHAQIERLHAAGVPFCVASSGLVSKMRITLGVTGLLPLLGDVLFSASMVENGKPAPDLFLHAARSMGHEPAGCVVVEDSVPGVLAAVAAGMRAVGYAGDPETSAEALRAAGADVIHDMAALGGMLGLSPAAA